ncbi:MAG: lysylphosphatidylglycerol synthase transmembrane domain-containing protein [Bacteroidales bacterium]|nr:lysylphosphatidylglycerol synthase transmembrane domain-containing protein [Bacteroidales bacterium]
MKKKTSSILQFVIFIGIGIFFIYWFLLKLDPEQKQAIWLSFVSANYGWVAVGMIVCLLSHFVRAARWQLLYAPIGCRPGLGNTFGAVVVAYLANLAFPRLGEVMRCAVLRTSSGIPMEQSLGTVITERIVDMLCFVLIVLLGLAVVYDKLKDWLYHIVLDSCKIPPHTVAVTLAALAAFCVVALLFYLFAYKRLLRHKPFQKISSLLRGLSGGIKSILHLGHRNFFLFVAYSICLYGLYILGGYIVFRAFPETAGLPFEAAFMLYLFGSVGMAFSQGGIGIYPVFVAQSLSIYGVPAAVSTAAGWLLWGSQQAVVAAAGMAFLVYFSIIKNKKKQEVMMPPENTTSMTR